MGKLEEVVLNCQFITPAFIYGNNSELELRADSIKGLMRYWWRATYTQNHKIEDIRNKENSIFGGVVKEDSSDVFYKAKVNIVVTFENKLTDKNRQLIYKNNFQNCEGIRYLFYSMILKNKNKNENKNKEKEHFICGMSFKVTFYYDNKNKEYVYEYLRAFNALQLFGGIGSRNRKGAGNFVVTSIKKIDTLEIIKVKESIYSEEWIKENNKSLYIDYYYDKILKCDPINLKYSNLRSENCEILKINNIKTNNLVNDYTYILNTIGQLYKESRKTVGIGKGPDRGKSPLIIKIIKDGNLIKVLLIKLGGDFSDDIENKIVDELFEKCKSISSDVKILK